MMITTELEHGGELGRLTPISAPEEQTLGIQALSRALRDAIGAPPRGPSCRLIGPLGEETAVPESVFRVLQRVTEVLARGDSVTVVPVKKKLTTQQAANLLNVSRQYLVRILEEGRIPFSKTGRHRRILIEDVLAYRARRDRERKAGLRSLAEMSEGFDGHTKSK